MSLTNRLSLFFLAALAFVLASFSLTLYLLVRTHLSSQLDERLHAAMKALIAAVEVHPQDVEWEPLERRFTLGEDGAADQPRWTLHDLSGKLQDRSFNLTGDTETGDPTPGGWRILIRRLRAGNFTAEVVDGHEGARWAGTLANIPLGKATSNPLPDDRTYKGDGLLLTVAVSEAPVSAMLHRLAISLIVASAVTWILAAVWGRWLCRRALRPISQMATSARSIRRDSKPTQTLDVPSTRDELEDLGTAFNELLGDLRESLERQRRFTGDASHQLRTPLTAMLASVEVVLRQERSQDEYRRVLEIVLRRGGQLRQIIESLLFLARADGAASLGAPEQIDVNDWCENWLDAWAEHPRASDFAFQASHALAVTRTHPALLGQVLDNLLDNACTYSEPTTPIAVAVQVANGQVCIAISDHGYGIAQEQQSLIFEPFYRTTEARWQGTTGIGLGLAIVNRLAAILGAKIEVVSEPGKGSSFRVLLPACHDITTQSQCETAENEATAQTTM